MARAAGKPKKKTTRPGPKSGSTRSAGTRKKSVPATVSKAPLIVLVSLILISCVLLFLNRNTHETGGGGTKSQSEAVSKDVPRKTPIQETADKVPDTKEQKKSDDKKEVAGRSVKIFFIKINESDEKIYLSAVQRQVTGKAFLKSALEELLKGPSGQEKKKGYVTAIPESVKIRGVTVYKKTAVVDFNGAIGTGAGGTILLNRIDQIVYTATQFPEIESVEITVNGKKQKTLGADGFSISGPLQRRE